MADIEKLKVQNAKFKINESLRKFNIKNLL
jgi:hypothetical protein